jgi:hypothetical protein
VNLKKRGFWACPALKKGGSGYPLYPDTLITIKVSGCRFYPSRGASRSKQGTKIEEKPFSGKENANTVKKAISGFRRLGERSFVRGKK